MTTRNGQIKNFTLNFGPQYPAAHGVSRSVLEMNGEVVERAEPHIGSLQCGTKPLLDFLVEIREKSIQFLMEIDFCEFSPELEDHFEIFEHIRGFHVTILTSATHKMRLYHRGVAFFQKDEGESQ